MRREHYIAVTCASPNERDLDFSNHAKLSQAEFLDRVVVTSTPPPKREVVLVLNIQEYNQIFSSSLGGIFGFIFEKTLFWDGTNLRLVEFCNELDGLAARLVRENSIIKYYGIYFAFYVGEIPERLSSQLFSFLKDWCSRAGSARNIEIDFDIIEDPAGLTFVLKNELRKIVHGDMKAQFSASSAAFDIFQTTVT